MRNSKSATKGTAGIIGVGVMGVAIANNLVEAGFDVVGYDISPAGRERQPSPQRDDEGGGRA